MSQNNKKYNVIDEIEFLMESNAIEGEYDADSLFQASVAWGYIKEEKEISTGMILKSHKILMLHQKLMPNEKGYFRDVMVYIGGGPALVPEKIREVLDQLILNMNDLVINGQYENKIFLERMVKQHHVQYEAIHPFVDGNGRTGRMFMNWQRLQLGLPIHIIHEGKEQMEYYKWFDNTDEI